MRYSGGRLLTARRLPYVLQKTRAQKDLFRVQSSIIKKARVFFVVSG